MNYTLVVFLSFFIYTASVSESKCPCADKNCQNVHESTCECQLGWFGSSCQMQNIVLGRPTNQSSTYSDTTQGGPYPSKLAVDGNASSNLARDKSCTYTSLSAPPPSQWSVYLQEAFNISHIKIFLSNSDGAAKNGFKVYVGDTLCYLPNKTFEKEAILDFNCTNPIRGTSLSVKINGTLLSLCEVQVFVCSDRWFGEDCNYQCHCGNMTEVCDKVNGYCRSGCTAGKHGPGCLTNCTGGRFGPDCSKDCHCKDNDDICYKNTGHCESGCTAGKHGDDCQTDCTNGSFGFNCTEQCHCSETTEVCNKTNGHCASGCIAGKQGYDCQKDCTDGSFGHNCSKTCLCLYPDEACNKTTGHCADGCTAGKHGDDCQTDCTNGYFGLNCTKQCHCHNTAEVCNTTNGHCASGCIAGKQGYDCQKDCTNGSFGLNCTKQCHCSETTEACNKTDGHCDSGCIAGKQGYDCQKDCTDGRFGRNCSKTCLCLYPDEACNKTTGHCADGCTAGKQGVDCQTDCTNGSFGFNCTKQCHCSETTEACNTTDGHCDSGCIAGKQGYDCQTDCTDGSFGRNCSKTCLCLYPDEACNKTTGHCADGCTAGKQGVDCQTDCTNGSFGLNCTKQCHCSETTEACNKTDGHCDSGCIAGKQGYDCQTDCTDGSFGHNCSKTCLCLYPDEACNNTTGHCADGCTAGKQGVDCQTDCTNGSFGLNCTKQCHCSKATEACNKTDGHCDSGCIAGKQGYDCQKDCTDGSFGHNCSKKCVCIKADEACNKTTGHCESGCTAGKHGDDCQTDCTNGSFGVGCRKLCHCFDTAEVCNKTNGHCDSGCIAGKVGDNCQTVMKLTQPSSTNAGMVAGIVVTVLVLIIVAVAGFVIWRKRARKLQDRRCAERDERSFKDISENDYPKDRKKRGAGISDKTTSPVKKSTASSGNKNSETKKDVRQQNVYENTDPYYNILPSPIPLATLRQYITERLSGVGFDNEYKLLRSGLTAAHEEGKKPENKKRNRYIELFPYDHSRVVLSPDGDAKSDYINASYIKGFHESSIFIAAQGPNLVTVDDFWRMIWQENVTTVVMLTRLMEMTRKKCEQYWPNEKETKTYGSIISRASLSTIRAEFTIRTFIVHHSEKPSAKRVVTQLHFTSWPDHDVPSAPALVGFWKQYRILQEDINDNEGPVVVHCSAGVGRTGTFIGLDSLFDEAESENKVNVFTCVSKMRESRLNMVQTASQYRFVHESLLEAIESKDTFYTSSDFEKKFGTDTAYTRVQESDISKQFQSLDSMRKEPKEELVSDARLPENVKKNKNQEVVPANKSRPFLSTSATGRSDYINAVVLPSATQPLRVIATQTPLNDTVVDFWRLVYDHDCFTIVCLDSIKDLYPTTEHPIDCKPFRISLSQEDNTCDSFQKIQITLNIPGNADSTRQITVYLLKVGLTGNTSTILEFVNEVDRKANTGEHKLLVHCVDGSRLCGLFCSVLNIISKLKLDKKVDIYLTVRELQCIRPQFIDTYEQYKFCYDMVKEYHRSSTVYANM